MVGDVAEDLVLTGPAPRRIRVPGSEAGSCGGRALAEFSSTIPQRDPCLASRSPNIRRVGHGLSCGHTIQSSPVNRTHCMVGKSRSTPSGLTSISLFTGAGGLDLGLEAAGFTTLLCVEEDESARKTVSLNRPSWQLSDPGDIHELTPRKILAQAGARKGEVTVLAGGPPCQPFSKSGYWRSGDTARLRDPRARTLRAYLAMLESALPEVLLLENVAGLAYSGKSEGLRLLQQGIKKVNRARRTSYKLQVLHINSADYGVPQLRERVFLLAHRDGRCVDMPSPTHGDPEAINPDLEPYRTAWDAIGDLDTRTWPTELDPTGSYAGLLPSIPEGWNYLWHTRRGGGEPLFGWRKRYWSFLLKLAKSKPSWTIQAKPGPSTGPFHWRNRRLSIRELCRLQTIPDEYVISGTYPAAHRQAGNAVPPLIGELLGNTVRSQLLGHRPRRRLSLLQDARPHCPRAQPSRAVPEEFLALRGEHSDHPGTGKGPGARRREVRTG